jgi:hypothetical protein
MPGVAGRGPYLFALAARLLDIPFDPMVADAANSFVSADLGRRGYFDVAGQRIRRTRGRVPAKARPLTAFGALARRDMRTGGPPFEPEASPGRAFALLLHRITGRY